MTDEKNRQPPTDEDGASEATPEDENPESAETAESEDGGEFASAEGWGAGGQAELEAENADLRDKLLRLVAEMENLRRRTERDKADTAKYAISNFARDVLTVADNIQRAIDHVPEEAAEQDPALKNFLEGIQVTERELLNVMERHGIARLDPQGERFDPNRHQAMLEIDDASVAEGTIVQVVQAGYVIAERVLRPAMVAVAKGGPKAAKAGDPARPPKAANDDAAQKEPEASPADSGASGSEKPAPKKPKVGGTVDKSA